MSSAQNHISKGYYAHSQIEQFISVKNYIFTRNNDEKHLLLRFSNLSDFVANSLEFYLIQLDSTGKVLDRSKLCYKHLNFVPGATFTPRQSILVHDFCTDFKVEFTLVTSGDYRYQVQGQQVTVLYEDPQNDENQLEPIRSVWEYSVRPLRPGNQRLAVACGIFVLLLLFGWCSYRMYARYDKAMEKLEKATVSYQDSNSPIGK